jgi:hypothetical protein
MTWCATTLRSAGGSSSQNLPHSSSVNLRPSAFAFASISANSARQQSIVKSSIVYGYFVEREFTRKSCGGRRLFGRLANFFLRDS